MYKELLKPILFNLDAEEAHDLAIRTAKLVSSSQLLQQITESIYGFEDPSLERTILGLHFKNPIGLAAGFDKNATTIPAMEALGFGFTEVGSITANSSPGNTKPRAFRLPDDNSLVNRMGLNNDGAEVIINRLKNIPHSNPLGINIAKTHDPNILGDAAILDYKTSLDLAEDAADYITINISCPNTEEGKTFEDVDTLKALLDALSPAERSKPLLIKFSVDLELEELASLVAICEDMAVAGYVATNTSSGRTGLKSDSQLIENIGRGGLSGEAIAQKSTKLIHWLRNEIKTNKPIIGVGGISSPEAAEMKLEAGADLLQIYTGLVFEGPGLVKRIKQALVN